MRIGARAALAHLVDHARDGDRLAAEEARGRPRRPQSACRPRGSRRCAPLMKRGRSFTNASIGCPLRRGPASRARRRGAPRRSIPADPARRSAHRLADGVAWPGRTCRSGRPRCALRVLFAELQGRGEAVHERGAVGAEPVEAARTDQRLEHAAIELLQIEPAAQVFETRERPCASRSPMSASTAPCPTPLHGAEAVADRASSPTVNS